MGLLYERNGFLGIDGVVGIQDCVFGSKVQNGMNRVKD